MDGTITEELTTLAEEIPKDIQRAIKKKLREFSSKQLHTLALIRTGISAKEICTEVGITHSTYNKIYKTYEEGNFDMLTTRVMENWENILRAKMMSASERALDKVLGYMEEDLIKDAKIASEIFSSTFEKFRLSTGKSTENIETSTLRLTQMIESRTGLQKPNQSVYHENIITIDTKAPSLVEAMQ